MRACVIRPWVLSILLGCSVLGGVPAILQAQTPAAAPQSGSSAHPAGGAATQNSSPAMAEAYRALDAKRLDDAAMKFIAILAKEPGNPRALAGMGYVRLQQANYLGAVSFLEQAKQALPNDKAVADALDTARFGFILGEGSNALNTNDLATAEKRYREALALRPDNPDALQGLGNTLMKQNQPKQAIPVFERVVAAQPGFVDAWRELLTAQYQVNGAAAALAVDRQLPDVVRAALTKDPAYLKSLALADSSAGRNADAQKVLEDATKLTSGSGTAANKTELGLQLADAQMAQGHPADAASIYGQMMVQDGGNVRAWQGMVQSEHAMGRDPDALSTYESMPSPVRQSAMRDAGFCISVAKMYEAAQKMDAAQDVLQTALTQETSAGQKPSAPIQMQLADLYIRRGTPQMAYPIYKQITVEDPNRADAWAGLISTLHLTGHDSEAKALLPTIPPAAKLQLDTNQTYLQAMSAVYGDTGQPRQASQFLNRAAQDYTTRNATTPADVEIKNAWLLYNGVDDSGLFRQLMDLGRRTDLTDAQRKDVETIWTDWALRRANQAVAAGNSSRAVAILTAAAQTFPENAAAQKELAAGFAHAGAPQQAVMIYKAQNMTGATSADWRSAIGAALDAGDTADAETFLHGALKAYPSDPQVLLLGARLEQERGDTTQAMKYYRASLKAMPPGSGKPPALPGASTAIGMPSAQPGEDLSILLAPGSTDLPPAPAGAANGASPVQPDVTAPVSQPPNTGVDSTLGPQSRISQPATAGGGDATYRPYTSYIAPPAPNPAPTTTRGAATAVQLGNNAAPPVQQQAEMTDVLPTARYAQNARKDPALASDPNAAAARAERIRRQQEEAAAQRGGSAQGQGQAGGPQVAQPSSVPPADVSQAESSSQQYPQPRTQPPPLTSSARTGVSHPPTVAPQTTVAQPVPSPVQAAPTPSVTAAAVPVTPVASALQPRGPSQTQPVAASGLTGAELAARSSGPVFGYRGAQAPLPGTSRQQAEEALAALEGSYSGWVGATGMGRYRSGTAGLDRLYDVEAPVEASAVLGHAARITAVARPVFLNSGTLGGTTFAAGAVPFLGTLPASTLIVPAQQSSNGVGGELQLMTRDVGAAVGYTPYEFLVHNVTGRLNWRPFGGHLTLLADRQPVRETQLSYAGLRDPGVSAITGPIWGGVVATTGGARLDLGNAAGKSAFYIAGDGGVLTGRHVPDNHEFGGEAGANFRVGSWPGAGTLTVGALFAGRHYELNEVGLSYGQGGYFSPQYYYAAAAPVAFRGSRGTNFHYALTGSLGMQTFEQDQAVFYPLDPVLQSGFGPCTLGQASSVCGLYPRTTTTGFRYATDNEVSYRFAEHWYAGGFLWANNSFNYNTVSGGFFLRYAFRKQEASEGRPTGLFPVDGLRPLRIP